MNKDKFLKYCRARKSVLDPLSGALSELSQVIVEVEQGAFDDEPPTVMGVTVTFQDVEGSTDSAVISDKAVITVNGPMTQEVVEAAKAAADLWGELNDDESKVLSTAGEKFTGDMREAGYDVEFYNGRNFYEGPAVFVDSSELQDVIRATTVEVQTDQMGKTGLVVYPR